MYITTPTQVQGKARNTFSTPVPALDLQAVGIERHVTPMARTVLP